MDRGLGQFKGGIAEISKSVILELMSILGAYRNALVLVGGWAPYFLLDRFGKTDSGFQHVGSIDIDIVVNPHVVSKEEYATIVELMEKRGYTQRVDSKGRLQPYIFEREVILPSGKREIVEVDFLGPEYGGTGRSHRHQRIQPDLLARKARGSDIVFDHYFEYELKGKLPSGAENTVRIRVADVVACLTMKGVVLGGRYKEKDAYDIYSVISYYKNGPGEVAYEIKLHLSNKLVRESISVIAEKFKSMKSVGPRWVADFLLGPEGATPAGNRDMVITDAYMRVQEFLNKLK